MNPKLLYFITEDWFFCSHFLERAVAAQEAGFEVIVLCHLTTYADIIRRHGLRILSLDIDRCGLNPIKDLNLILQIVRIYHNEHPDIVHHIALKPILYGTIAAKIVAIKHIINAPVGMGYIFTSRNRLALLLRVLLKKAFRFLLNPSGSMIVLENRDDLNMLLEQRMIRNEAAALIRGAGVDLDRFFFSPEPDGIPKVLMTARMLWDKGVGDFVEAAAKLRNEGIQAHFLLAGMVDESNPAAIKEHQLRIWSAEGFVDWLGHRDDIPELLASCHIVCLPSYREGLPKSLLEALAAGRPIVASDVPGCREVVRHEYNGLLVPAADSAALAAAIRRLIEDPELRKSMGERGRLRAEAEFSSPIIIKETLSLYEGMLHS